ncbi:MAG: OmpA family protein [Melioribacteraceae bacterium]|nr:OmpA family protein [Melioribacteraceae bacterium]
MIKLILIIHLLFSVLTLAQSERDELFSEVETILNQAKLDNADVLCADAYSNAVEEYVLAKGMLTEGKSPVDIREKLEASISYLTKMNNDIEGKQELFASTIAKRNSALDSGADKNAIYFWELGERKFQEIIEDFEDNDTKSISKNIKVTEEYYSTAKLYSNKANSLINDSESLKEATNKQANLLAPNSYEKAEDKMFETLNLISSGKRISDINNSITSTELLFDMASVNSSKYLSEYPEIIAVREDAKIVGADRYTKELWNEAEEGLRESAEAFEEDDFEKADDLAKEAATNYTISKQTSLKDYFLKDTRNEINLAIEEGAEEFAPKTLKQSNDYLNEVTSLIESDSYSLPQIQRLTKKSYTSANNARRITEIAKRMEPGDESWEDIIIAKEGYLLDSNNEELVNIPNKGENDYSDLIEKLEDNINDEVDITEEDGKVILLLKNIKFSIMSSRLNKDSKASLDKVIAEIKDESFLEATIVCYTDNIGTKSANIAISQKRAEAILKYILEKDNSNKYYIEGKGEENPIASNSTSEGRIKNRRVEIEIK